MSNRQEGTIYGYFPQIAGNAIFLVLFLLVLGPHLYKTIKFKVIFWSPFLIGIAFEIIGYAIRLASHSGPNVNSLSIYATQTALILLAPVLYAASMYMTISRLLRSVGAPQACVINPKLVTKIFVTSDVVCFLLQVAGAAMMSNTQSSEAGSKICLAGLGFQLAFFCFYVLILVVSHYRLSRLELRPTPTRFQWPFMLWTLYFGCAMIIIRSIYRLIEFSQGFQGWVINHEGFAFGLDATPMLLLCISFIIIHPSDVFARPEVKAAIDAELEGSAPYDGEKVDQNIAP